MDLLLKKMTWKEGLSIQIWNSTEEFEDSLHSWTKSGIIHCSRKPDFLMGFVKNKAELSEVLQQMLVFLSDDQQLRNAYPKKNSKK
ncbi:MAG: hypothetical protein ACI9O5_000050 [Algoriphagus sp.]|jgi:hypothetical protein